MRARIAFRALITAGLSLAWLGVLLPWERRESEASGFEESIGGFDASRLFWIVLAVATVLAVLALWRHWRWAFVALAAAALVLVGLAVLELRASVDASSAFVSVVPGAGVILALVGAAAVVVRGDHRAAAAGPPARRRPCGVRARHRRRRRVAADDGRPDDGAIADAGDDPARAMAFLGDTLYTVHGSRLYAQPAPDRDYDAAGVWSSEWTPDDPLFDEFEPTGLAFAGDTAYVVARPHRPADLGHARRRAPDARGPPPRERREPAIPDGRRGGRRTSSPARSRPVPTAASTSCRATPSPAGATAELTTLAPRFGAARDIATDARGARLRRRHRQRPRAPHRPRRQRPDGRRHRGRARAASSDGLDDPLALDPRRCTAVKALAVDRERQPLPGAPERRR